MTDPTRLRHADGCPATFIGVVTEATEATKCRCGLSALREAVASGDPLAVLEVLGLGGTLERVGTADRPSSTDRFWSLTGDEIAHPVRYLSDDVDYLDDAPLDAVDDDRWTDDVYRVVRPLPDAPEVSP